MSPTKKSTSSEKPQDDPQAPEAEAKKPKAPKAPRPDEMSAEVLEFITAIDDYKRANQRPFPSWSEILDVLKTLGYQKHA